MDWFPWHNYYTNGILAAKGEKQDSKGSELLEAMQWRCKWILVGLS